MSGLLQRHEEIRLAVRFFLQALHKYQRAGAVPDKQRVLYDFARYKGLTPVAQQLRSSPSPAPSKSGPR
jgi:hypothetical protein